ncbi:MAG: Rieske 2Fe-2S domain-containing protein, partial [Acidimicrobiales bacterium]
MTPEQKVTRFCTISIARARPAVVNVVVSSATLLAMSPGLGNLDPSLRHAWHPLCRSSDVTGDPRSFRLLNEDYVVYRLDDGAVSVFRDRCPHRRAPLSLGACEGATLRCAYHGWVFDAQGACVEIPALGEGATLPSRAHLEGPAGVAES